MNPESISAQKPELQDLPQVKDRMTFLYLERAVINRADNAVTVTDARGTVYVPATSISVILLGPSTSITHRAMELIGDVGTSVIWVGEEGVRYYAHGKPLTHSSRLLVAQATLVSNVRTRASVARRMYSMRFPDEDVEGLTLQQLRGKEGARVRAVYRNFAKKTGVPWNGREYDPNNYDAGSAVNKALSAAHACLYGLAHSVIVALGCSPGLGFIHSGHERSFVYDIADLYKAEITIPIAFEMAEKYPEHGDIGTFTRHAVRDALHGGRILVRAVSDIRTLLLDADANDNDVYAEILELWDDKEGFIKSGVAYGKDMEEGIQEGYGEFL